ncbi:hypothetical protein APHAL10511_004673 [Amanita phalloides]|nr:hypothetical protein APHAL10511_004673 [Amanita phalloides]
MQWNFWNKITISLQESDWEAQKEHARTLDVLNMFLECNLGYPFSFKLDLYIDARRSPYFSPIFDKIISESARWRRVTLKLGIADLSALYHVKGKLECLESLEFSLEDHMVHDIDLPEAFTDLFMSAPCFMRMKIYPLLTWNFNWSIMTVLHLELTQREQEARLPLILSQAMQMETLSISFYQGSTGLPSHQPITLPNLTALETDCLSLLQIMVTPSLKELYVPMGWHEVQTQTTAIGTMKSFIHRSQCQIQILAIESLDAASAIEILSHTPDIRVLYMGTIAGIVNIFRWLNKMHRAKTPRLTRLQSLSIQSWFPPGRRDIAEISDFVARRQTRIEDAGTVVEKLHKIDFGGHWGLDDVEVDDIKVRLRKSCELHGIQYSVNGDEAEIEGCHDRSLDPYVYSSFV